MSVVALAGLSGGGCDSSISSTSEVQAAPETVAPTQAQSAKASKKPGMQSRTLRKMN
jgi:hypothetical protein